ncbi:MAG: energy transducer TonB [Bacteriovoracaceae bacterium]|jgi:protein TonB|nr:energy transducer TonB [Bacteriovoracaceae bacterium]
MERRLNKTFMFFLLGVFFIHLALVWSKLPKVSFDFASEQAPKIIKLKLLKQFKNQIVQTTKSEDKSVVKKAFLGKKNQSFTKQTIARKIGTFKTASKGSIQGINHKNSKAKMRRKKVSLSDLAISTDSAKNMKIDEKKQSKTLTKKGMKTGRSKVVGLSQSNDYVQDIALGDFTKLNTQEFEFYGFYHRIRQKLEQFWGRNIQDQADKLIKTGRSIASDTNHVTALQIELDSQGRIINVKVNSASGITELDQTAVRTFNEAGPFPNPPKKMLKGGKALINWSFVVKT